MEAHTPQGGPHRNRSKKRSLCPSSRPWHDNHRRRARRLLQVWKRTPLPRKAGCHVQVLQAQDSPGNGFRNPVSGGLAPDEGKKDSKARPHTAAFRRLSSADFPFAFYDSGSFFCQFLQGFFSDAFYGKGGAVVRNPDAASVAVCGSRERFAVVIFPQFPAGSYIQVFLFFFYFRGRSFKISLGFSTCLGFLVGNFPGIGPFRVCEFKLSSRVKPLEVFIQACIFCSGDVDG